MAGSTYMKKALATMDQFHLDPVHLACQKDGTIQVQNVSSAQGGR